MCAENVKKKHSKIIFVTIPVMVLAATVLISFVITEDAFARERYTGDSTSQAAAVNNECLNPIVDSNTIDNAVGVGNCGGTVSQQDESGSATAPITHQTANPTIELQRATTTQPPPTTQPPGQGAPSLTFGSVQLNVDGLTCLGFDDPSTCPSISDLRFAVSSNLVSTTEASNLDILTFGVAYNIQLVGVGSNIAVTLRSNSDPSICSSVSGNPNLITGNVPPAGSTVTCSFDVVLRQ
jgi:hypothetical protein